jgi:hypothetical protein
MKPGLGLQLVGNTPIEFAELVRTETPAWGKVIRDAGIAPQQGASAGFVRRLLCSHKLCGLPFHRDVARLRLDAR